MSERTQRDRPCVDHAIPISLSPSSHASCVLYSMSSNAILLFDLAACLFEDDHVLFRWLYNLVCIGSCTTTTLHVLCLFTCPTTYRCLVFPETHWTTTTTRHVQRTRLTAAIAVFTTTARRMTTASRPRPSMDVFPPLSDTTAVYTCSNRAWFSFSASSDKYVADSPWIFALKRRKYRASSTIASYSSSGSMSNRISLGHGP